MSPMSSLGLDNLGTDRKLESMFSDEARALDKFQAEEGGLCTVIGGNCWDVLRMIAQCSLVIDQMYQASPVIDHTCTFSATMFGASSPALAAMISCDSLQKDVRHKLHLQLHMLASLVVHLIFFGRPCVRTSRL